MLTKADIDSLWDFYGMAEEECQLAGEPIEIVLQGDIMSSLLGIATALFEIKRICEDETVTHCYTTDAQIGYDTMKNIILDIINARRE